MDVIITNIPRRETIPVKATGDTMNGYSFIHPDTGLIDNLTKNDEIYSVTNNQN